MAVGEGKFVLYSRITPPLQAGDYCLTARQTLTATKEGQTLGAAQLPVADLPAHFRVRSPRFALPPDQVLSTFPPANSEGDYGSRLPQIVIKRRTLPWERSVGPGGAEQTPWLALVLIAEGEAELKLNQPVAECVTPGTTLEGAPEVELGNYLQVRKSVIDQIFPTRKDVPLLAHAREVDIHDTELMMGDDDGFLAVVIANRLPLAAKDAEGNEVPMKYLACLINLEEQFPVLRERAPDPAPFTASPVLAAARFVTVAGWDQLAMGMPPSAPAMTGATAGPVVLSGSGGAAAPNDNQKATAKAVRQPLVAENTAASVPFQHTADWSAQAAARFASDVYAEMAAPFARAEILSNVVLNLDPVYRFPVLLHWSFTSVGQTSFRKLMEDLDIGLLGTVPGASPNGRPPLEAVETGHVGLAHRTRVGDEVRAWYRGPLVPHPTQDPAEGRLPLAHASDQLRIVVPDGREDLSLAAAFEIGRLMALARPSMVAALMRWRQLHYQAARREVIWQAQAAFLEAVGVTAARLGPNLGVLLGRGLTRVIADRPEEFLGDPRALVTAGRPLPVEGPAVAHLAAGLVVAERVLQGGPEAVLTRLQKVEIPTAPLPELIIRGGDMVAAPAVQLSRDILTRALDRQLVQRVVDTLPSQQTAVLNPGLIGSGVLGSGVLGTDVVGSAIRGRGHKGGQPKTARKPDALDRLMDSLSANNDDEEPR